MGRIVGRGSGGSLVNKGVRQDPAVATQPGHLTHPRKKVGLIGHNLHLDTLFICAYGEIVCTRVTWERCGDGEVG